MSTRQYIGARYVPKFFDWGGSAEWRSGVAYEALTIVTRNGNSYTSKVPVPSNIGAPESNPDYWVSTGIYNEQIESIRDAVVTAQGDIDNLESDVTGIDTRLTTAEGDIDTLETGVSGLGTRMTTAEGDIDTLETGVSGLGTRMTTAEGDIDTLETGVSGLGTRMTTAEGNITIIDGRVDTAESDIDTLQEQMRVNNSERIIVMTDSYGVDGVTGGSSFLTKLQTMYGSNMIGSATGGCGFHTENTSIHTNFLGVLQSMSVSDKASIRRIYVFGGANDGNVIYSTPSDLSVINQKIAEFCGYCRTNYPNAIVYIGFIGWYYDSARWASYYNVKNAYKAACSNQKNAVFVSGLDYPMHISTCINHSDLVHPTANGSTLLFMLIANVVKNKSSEATFVITTTFTPTIGPNFDLLSGARCCVRYHGGVCKITGNGTLNRMYFHIDPHDGVPIDYNHKHKLFDLYEWLPFGVSEYNGKVQSTPVTGVALLTDNSGVPFVGVLTLEHDGIYLICSNVALASNTVSALLFCPFDMTIVLDEM